MDKKIILVNAWGRGDYLAHQLNKKGINTVVWDVSSLLTPLSSAEREGPFGVFLPSHLNDTQKHYLTGDEFYLVPQGFSVLNSQGPVEFKGPLSPFFRKTRKDFQNSHTFLNSSKLPRLFSIPKKTHTKEDNWFLRLSKEWAGCTLASSSSIKKTNFKSPLFADYVLREASQRHFESIKNSLKEKGIVWVELEKTTNQLSLQIKKKYMELSYHEEQKADCLIWTLSGLETEKYFSHLRPLLFPDWKKPLKIWRRFLLSWNSDVLEKLLPALLWIPPDLPSSSSSQQHSELYLSLKKHPNMSRADLWVLCPYEKNKENILLEKALKRLQSLFPGFSFKASLPDLKEACNPYFALYETRPLLNTNTRLCFLNPEAIGKMDSYSLLQYSDFCVQNLQKTLKKNLSLGYE